MLSRLYGFASIKSGAFICKPSSLSSRCRYLSPAFSTPFPSGSSFRRARHRYTRKKKKREPDPYQAVEYENVGDRLEDFRRAIATDDSLDVIASYDDLPKGHQILNNRDYLGMVGVLCRDITRLSPRLDRDTRNQYVGAIMDSYRKGLIKPFPALTTQILTYFANAGQLSLGNEFWKWARQKDDRYTNLACYGAAIELMASGTDSSLEHCESIFDQAFMRFSRGFNEYHLRPGAVTAKPHLPTTIPGASIRLLQGIALARLIHGNWLHAYLSLDRASQLHPSGVKNPFFSMFMENRPLAETYRLYCVLYSSGVHLQNYTVQLLVRDLCHLQKLGRGAELDLDVALAILSAVHHRAAAGQSLDYVLRFLLASALKLLPKQSLTIDESSLQKAQDLASTLRERIYSLFSFNEIKMNPSKYFEILIDFAGKLNDKRLLKNAADTLAKSNIALEEGMQRQLMYAARLVGDIEPIRYLWTEQPDFPDIDEEWLTSLQTEPDLTKNPWDEASSDNNDNPESQASEQSRFNDCLRNAEKFVDVLERFLAIVQGGDVMNMRDNPPERSSIAKNLCAPAAWQRQLYTELVVSLTVHKRAPEQHNEAIEPNEPATTPRNTTESDQNLVPGALLPTNISLEEIRYQNWCAINDILVWAYAHEKNPYHPLSDEAVSNMLDPSETMLEDGTRSESILASKKTRVRRMMHHRRDVEALGVLENEGRWRKLVTELRQGQIPKWESVSMARE